MKFKLVLLFTGFITFASAQTGISWNPAMNMASNAYSNQHPRITLDGAGNPLVIWGQSANQSVYFSRWTGTSFTTPIKLNPDWMGVATAGWMGPDIASKGDTVYVVVKRAPENDESNRIFIFSSFNGGETFNPPVELAIIGNDKSRFPTIAIDTSGNPIVAFMKFNANFLESRWVVTKSNDFGNTFSPDVLASGWGNSAEVCDCCPGALISSVETLAMLYRDNNSNYRNTWLGLSTDNGTSFDKGFSVDGNNWFVMSCPASGPDGVIIGDTLYSTFMSGGSGSYRTYFSRSSLSEGTLANMSNPGGTIPGLGTQNYPRIATDGTALALVWQQSVNGETQLPIQFSNDVVNGEPFSYDLVDVHNITNADVAMSMGNIFVVWQDDGSGTIKFRSGTYQQVNTSIQETLNNSFSVVPNPAFSQLTLTLPFGLLQAEIQIRNVLGELVLATSVTANSTLDISFLPQGMFFVQVMDKHHYYTTTFIKQ